MFPVLAVLAAGSAAWQAAAWANVALALRRVRGVALAEGARVGVLVECRLPPTHTHHRTFSGFKKPLQRDWQLQGAVAGALDAELRRAGLAGVTLDAAGLKAAAFEDLVEPRFGDWAVGRGELLHRLRDGLGLRAVIVVRDAPVTACELGDEHGVTRLASEGTGLFTLKVGFALQAFAVVAMQWHVFLLDPPADLAYAPALRKRLAVPSVRLQDFRRGADPEHLDERDLEAARQQVLAFIQETAAAAAAALRPAAGQLRACTVPSSMR